MGFADPVADLPIPKDARAFFDPEKLRSWVFEGAKESFEKQLNKLETPDLKVNVKNLSYSQKNTSMGEQKKAILERRDLTVPLKGTVELIDKKTNKVLDSKETILAHIPYVTERNTSIFNGSEYISTNQLRLKPGVFSRIRKSGEAESLFNVASSVKINMRVIFNPKTEVFQLVVGTTKAHLYSVLRDFGIEDSAMRKAWGDEIYNKNKQGYDTGTVDKLYKKLFPYD